MKTVITLFAFSVAAFLGVVSCLPPPDGCQPYTTSCSRSGRPMVCSSSQRSTPLPGSVDCNKIGNGALVCCARRNSITQRVEFGCALPQECISQASDASTD